jgi:hypothetical protein
MGTVGTMEFMIRAMRLFGGETDIFPAWQGMQYMVNMMSGAGKLEPLDNSRYPDLTWTKLEDFFRENRNEKWPSHYVVRQELVEGTYQVI